MAKTTSQYLSYSLQSLIVSTLEKDGVFCNFFSKDYNEQATYEGGTGFRLSFNEYNNQIIKFHTLLKILTGEQRANIRESIPVIDFLNTNNTSLLYTYEISDKNAKAKEIDTTSIRAASTEETTALELIVNEDPFIINRAIVGEPIAEHFYNTVGNSDTPNLQTSPWLGNNYVEYLYRGIYDSPLSINGKTLSSSLLKGSFYAFESTASETLSSSDIYDSGTSYIKFIPNTFNSVESTLTDKLKKYDIRGILKIEDFAKIKETSEDSSDPYAVNDVTFLINTGKDGLYQAELNEEDICILIPRSLGISGLATLLILKKDDSIASMAETSLTWSSYKIYNSSEGTFGPNISGVADLLEVSKGELYHLIDYPSNAYAIGEGVTEPSDQNKPTPIPSSLQSDVDIICAEDIGEGDDNNANKWKIAGSYYKAFYIPISSYTSSKSFEEIKVEDSLPGYLQRTGVYERVSAFLNIDKIYTAKASGLLSGFYASPYKRDNTLITSEKEIPTNLSKVTCWKFSNEVDIAKEKGVSIEVGSKYFKGHLLGRGIFDNAPLKLTSHDLVEGKIPTRKDGTAYKGKILLTYDKLKNATSSLFNKVKVNDFNNFPIKSIDDVVTRADYEGRTYSDSEVKNLLTPDELSRISATSGTISYQSILNYPSKLSSLNTTSEGKLASDGEQIIQYFNTILSSIKDIGNNTYELYLDLTDESGPCVSRKTTYQKVTVKTEIAIYETKEHCGKKEVYNTGKTQIQEITNVNTSTTIKGGSIGDIYTSLDKNYEVSYEVNLVDVQQEDIEKAQRGELELSNITAQKGDAFNFKIKLITPLEAFSTKNSIIKSKFVDINKGSGSFESTSLTPSSTRIVPTGTVLVYPEYSKYLPSTMFLLSHEDLNLEEYGSSSTTGTRSMVSFLAKKDNAKPNSVVSYKVASVKSFKPSQIKKVRLKTDSNRYEEINYDYGLYPNYKVTTTNVITGFETIKVKASSSTVKNSQGYSFSFDKIKEGAYVKGGREVINREEYGKTAENTNSIVASNAKVKSFLRLSALQTDLSLAENTQEETESAAEEISLTSNKLTSREDSSTKNASESSTIEENIASQKFANTPSISATKNSNTRIITGKNTAKKVSKGNSSFINSTEGSISMGGGSSTPASATKSGINWYYTNRQCDAYWTTDRDGDETKCYKEYMVDVPIYTPVYSYTPSVGTSYDCYIYTLEFMQLSLDDINIYDQNDQEIKLSEFSDIKLIPMAYPSDFFNVTVAKDKNNLTVYRLNNKSDVTSLKDRLIIPGLPQFTTKEDLLTANTRGLNLEPIANMIFSGDSSTAKALDSILGNSIYSILKTWKLSGIDDNNSTQNPLLLEDLPALVSGLVEAEPTLEELGDDAFTINLGEDTYTITASDVNSLIGRIDNDDYHNKVNYTISYSEPSNIGDEYLSHITTTGFDDKGKELFIKELRKRLQNIKVTGEIQRELARPSLKRLSSYVTRAFSSSDALDEELCKVLDSYFGNDTEAFLKLGDSENMSLIQDGTTYSMGSFKDVYVTGSQLIEKMASIILDMANKARDAFINATNTPKLEKMKECFKPYYTDESINENIKATSYEDIPSNTNNSNLKLNTKAFGDDRIRSLLVLIKNNYNTKHPLTFETYSWSKMGYNTWVNTYKLNQENVKLSDFESGESFFFKGFFSLFWLGSALNKYLIRLNILRDLKKEISAVITDDLRSLLSSEEYRSPTRGEVLAYLNNTQKNSLYTNSTYGFKGLNEPSEDGDLSGNFCLTTIIPNYDPSTNTFTAPVSYTELNYDPTVPAKGDSGDQTTSSDTDKFRFLVRQNFTLFQEEDFDVKTIILKGLAEYVKTALEGTGNDRYFVKYVKGDSQPSGRSNSLYYRRYLALNNRMNTAEGTLAPLLPVLRNKEYFTYSDDYTRNLNETYEDIMEVVPVSKYEQLTWMPEQKATANTIALPGKFYYQAELDALREQIGDQCILTCTKCPVSDSCPFYNKEEIIKAYCTPAETLDLYFKDNELDLIAYTEEKRNSKGEITTPSYPDVWATSSDGGSIIGIDTDKLKKMHSYYSDILKKVSKEKAETFEGQDLNEVRKELKAAFAQEDFENLGYLLGARYGTVQKNNLAALANSDENFHEFNSKIPEYQYLYDAIYIRDTETYFNYATGDKLYNVAFEMSPGGGGDKRKYEGKVKLKLPTSLKALNNANPLDDVYLISDDTKDGMGNPIVPIIYLGVVGDLQWSLGIIEDPSKSAQSGNDTNVYAADMAQWCINYYKGHCTEDPIGDINSISNPSKTLEEDRDQYWMEEIKKKVVDDNGNDVWITLSGRPRESTGYQEPVVDPNNLSDVAIASGRPVVANYINFIRKFSIRIYDSSRAAFDEAGNPQTNNMWTIPWVKDCSPSSTKTLSNGSKISWDTQRLALPYMKTNLRLVIVKN